MAVEYAVQRWQEGKEEDQNILLAEELPFTIYYNRRELTTLLCSPEHLEELAIGHLAMEGLINSSAEITNLEIDQAKGTAWVDSPRQLSAVGEALQRRLISSGCAGFYRVLDAQLCQPVLTPGQVAAGSVQILLRQLQQAGAGYQVTGALHGAALFRQKTIWLHREDIGRHNAIDKLFGHCLLHNQNPAEGLISTGRISSDMLLKAAKMGLPLVLSRSVPTQLAAKLAAELNITLIGAIRGERFNVYTHPERMVGQ